MAVSWKRIFADDCLEIGTLYKARFAVALRHEPGSEAKTVLNKDTLMIVISPAFLRNLEYYTMVLCYAGIGYVKSSLLEPA